MSKGLKRQADIAEPALLVRINQLYRPQMSAEALYEATRGIWKVSGNRRDHVKYALAVFRGVVVEVYSVDGWARAGSSEYTTRSFEQHELDRRWEFTGTIARDDIRSRYLGASVAHYFVRGNANPVMYLNIGD